MPDFKLLQRLRDVRDGRMTDPDQCREAIRQGRVERDRLVDDEVRPVEKLTHEAQRACLDGGGVASLLDQLLDNFRRMSTKNQKVLVEVSSYMR